MANTFDVMNAAAKVYAESLYALANERGTVEEINNELRDLMSMRGTQPEFTALMNSAALDDDTRRTILRNIFKGRVSDLVLNTMLVMNDKGRLSVFAAMADAFAKMVDTRHGRQRVFVTSAVELTDEMRTRITAEATRLCGREAVLVERIDPAVLGGFVLQMGDRMVDASIRMTLRNMRAALRVGMEKHLHESGHRFVTAS